jgi:hypothetical protein
MMAPIQVLRLRQYRCRAYLAPEEAIAGTTAVPPNPNLTY